MRILFIGDIMGRSGREALQEHLPIAKEALKPDIIIVNGENAANGRGITKKIALGFYDIGVDCITTGNHIWDQREIIPYIDRDKKLLRPLNYPENTPGNGVYKYQLADGRAITIVNAMARLFMDALDDPFAAVNKLIQENPISNSNNAIFVDFHGETTSEKMSMGHYVDGRVSAVIGTHTHIPTADAHILSGGTAYMSDAGMSGDYNSVIGVRKDIAMNRFIKKMPGEHMIPAAERGMMCGALVVTNDATGMATGIEPVRMGVGLSETMPNI